MNVDKMGKAKRIKNEKNSEGKSPTSTAEMPKKSDENINKMMLCAMMQPVKRQARII